MSATFAALSNRHYRWLLGGNLAQFFAIAARMMICNLLAWEITGEEIALAQINLVLAVPMFFGALFAGALVDRWERKRLITAGLTIAFLSELSILIALSFHRLVFSHVLLVTFISGCIHPFVHPAGTALMYSFLGRAQMANGVALLSSGMNLSRILGPAIIGGVLALYDTTVAYGVVVSLFLIALLCQLQLPKHKPTASDQTSVLHDIQQGLRYLVRDRYIAYCLMFSLPPLMLLMTTQYMLVLFAKNVWGAGDAGLGVLLTAMGSGAFLGALFVARFNRVVGRSTLMLVGAVGAAIFFGAFSQATEFRVAVLCLLLANMFAAVSLVTNQVVIQLLSSEDARGRVSGYILMSYSLAPLALFPLSLLADKVGPQAAIFFAAVGVVTLVVVMYFGLSKIRNIDAAIQSE
ncbi:MFS transporter [Aurantivibrio plasticivorans]